MTRHLVGLLTALAAVAALAAGVGTLLADNLLVPVTWTAGAEQVAGDARYLLGGATTSTLTIVDPGVAERLWVFAPAVVWCLTAVVAGLVLQRVVRTLGTGDVFHPAGSRLVAALGTTVLVGGVLAAGLATAGNLVLVHDVLAATGGPVGMAEPSGEVVLPVTALAVAATLWGVAGLLRRGAILREDLRGLV